MAWTLSRRGFMVELLELRIRQPKQLVNDNQRLDVEFDELLLGLFVSWYPSWYPVWWVMGCSDVGEWLCRVGWPEMIVCLLLLPIAPCWWWDELPVGPSVMGNSYSIFEEFSLRIKRAILGDCRWKEDWLVSPTTPPTSDDWDDSAVPILTS